METGVSTSLANMSADIAYKQPSGTTIRVASMRDEGQTFQEFLMPSLCSGPWKSHCCCILDLAEDDTDSNLSNKLWVKWQVDLMLPRTCTILINNVSTCNVATYPPISLYI